MVDAIIPTAKQPQMSNTLVMAISPFNDTPGYSEMLGILNVLSITDFGKKPVLEHADLAQ